MYEQAVGYLQEARDWCLAHPERLDEGFVYNFTDLANLYDTLEQQDKALENISQAIAYSLALDSVVLSDLYRMKAGMFWKPEQKDSARFYILKALRLGEALSTRRRSQQQRTYFTAFTTNFTRTRQHW